MNPFRLGLIVLGLNLAGMVMVAALLAGVRR